MKKIISLLLALTMVVCSFSVVLADSVVEIATAEELIAVAATVAENGGEGITFKLTADIDLGGTEWTSYIGSYSKPFVGTFDGNGHVIRNYDLVTSDSNSIPDFQNAAALFRYVSGNAVIKDLGVENIVISSAINSWRECAGGIVGTLDGNAKVSGCYAKNIENTDNAQPELKAIGGIAAAAISDGVIVENCYTIDMKEFENGGDSGGGVVGGAFQVGKIENCYSTLTISRVPDAYASKVVNCYYETPAPWPHTDDATPESYPGNKVDDGAIKELAETLGAAFTADSADFPSNNGYPILSWQVNTKLTEGDAVIESATEADLATLEATIVFDKMLDASTIDKTSVLVDNDASYEVVVEDAAYVDTIKVVFDSLELATTYTISFTDAITTITGDVIAEGETFSFKTIDSLPDFEVLETTPANNAKKVTYSGTKVEAVYSLPIDEESLETDDITVTPAADFTVSVVDTTKLVVKFTEKLAPKTEYTVTFGTGIKSTSDTDAIENTIKFTTDILFGNIILNSNFEENDLSQYSDRNNNGSLAIVDMENYFGETSKVLSLSTAWGDQPVELKGVTLEPGSYYMGAWIMPGEGMNDIVLALSDDADYWNTKHVSPKENEWTYVSYVFDVTTEIKQVSIRGMVSEKKLYIDDWCLYDLSKAPSGTTELVSSSLKDGALNVSPYNLKLDLAFSSELRVGSIVEQFADEIFSKVVYDSSDASKVTVYFNELEKGSSYTVDFDKLVDIKGNAVAADSITFNTFDAPKADAKVVSTIPANDATDVSSKDLEISLSFDTPLDVSTISNIKVTPDISAVPAMAEGSLSDVVISYNKSMLKLGTKYTVTVPSTVKTSGGEFGTVPYEFSFTMITEDSIIGDINAALGDEAAVKTSIEGVYAELSENSGAYEYVLNNLPENADEIYKAISEMEAIESVDGLMYSLNSTSMEIILDNISDEKVIADMIENTDGIVDSNIQELFADYIVDADKEAIAETVISMKDKDYDEIVDAIELETVKEAFAAAGGATSVKKILNLVSPVLTGDDSIEKLLEKVEDSDYSSKIYGELQGFEMDDLSDISDGLQEAYDKYEDDDGDRGNGSIRYPGQGAADYIPVMPEVDANKDYVAIFSDLDDVEWARTSIDNLYAKGIINGVEEGIYNPNGLLTRYDFVKIAVMAVGGYDETATADFKDLGVDNWYYPYVASACKLGLINGIGDGMFGGDLFVTREDMVTILYRIAKSEGLVLTEQVLFFTDEAEIYDYAKEAVNVLSSNGIVNGVGDGKFGPKLNATRAEAAVIFDRFLTVTEK